MARRFVVASVPSTPDDDPEHLHLLGRATLERWFLDRGARRVSFDSVLDHLIAVARL